MKRFAVKLTDTNIEVFTLSDLHSAWTVSKKDEQGEANSATMYDHSEIKR